MSVDKMSADKMFVDEMSLGKCLDEMPLDLMSKD